MNQGYQYLVDGYVIQSVTTFEVNHIVIMPEERLFTIHLSVIVTKHTPYSLLVSKRNTVKLVFFHFGKMPDDVFGDNKLFLSVKSWLEELEFIDLQYFTCLRHEEGRINTDAVVTEHLLGVHAPMLVPAMTLGCSLLHNSLKNGNASAGSTGMSGTITSKSGNLFLNVRMVPLAADEPKPWK